MIVQAKKLISDVITSKLDSRTSVNPAVKQNEKYSPIFKNRQEASRNQVQEKQKKPKLLFQKYDEPLPQVFDKYMIRQLPTQPIKLDEPQNIQHIHNHPEKSLGLSQASNQVANEIIINDQPSQKQHLESQSKSHKEKQRIFNVPLKLFETPAKLYQSNQPVSQKKDNHDQQRIFDVPLKLFESPPKLFIYDHPIVSQDDEEQIQFQNSEVIMADIPQIAAQQPQEAYHVVIHQNLTTQNCDVEDLKNDIPQVNQEMELDQSSIREQEENHNDNSQMEKLEQQFCLQSNSPIDLSQSKLNQSLQNVKKNESFHLNVKQVSPQRIVQIVPLDIIELNRRLQNMNVQLDQTLAQAEQNNRLHTKQFPQLLRQVHYYRDIKLNGVTQRMIDTMVTQVLEHEISSCETLFSNYASTLPKQENTIITNHMQQVLLLVKLKLSLLIKNISKY